MGFPSHDLILGAMSAFYLRHQLPSSDPFWFCAHVGLQMTGYAAGVAGWATGLRLGSLSEGMVHGLHRKLGTALFGLGMLQMMAMFFRPKKTHKFRKYWKPYHHLVGYSCVVVAVVNVFQGFAVMQLQIGREMGLTNVYVAQLFRRQAQLKPHAVDSLRSAVPQMPDDLIHEMMKPPTRSYDPSLIQEPAVYRF